MFSPACAFRRRGAWGRGIPCALSGPARRNCEYFEVLFVFQASWRGFMARRQRGPKLRKAAARLQDATASSSTQKPIGLKVKVSKTRRMPGPLDSMASRFALYVIDGQGPTERKGPERCCCP